MNGLGAAIASALATAFLAVIVITAAVTAGLIYGIPWLWALIKPGLHSITG